MLTFKDGRLDQVIPNINTDEWLHLTVVTNGPRASDGGTIYLNGVPTGNTTKLDPLFPNGNTFGQGNLGMGSPNRLFPVLVDELYFWNKPLSTDEVKMIYKLHSIFSH